MWHKRGVLFSLKYVAFLVVRRLDRWICNLFGVTLHKHWSPGFLRSYRHILMFDLTDYVDTWELQQSQMTKICEN